jgi:hypothetical protein
MTMKHFLHRLITPLLVALSLGSALPCAALQAPAGKVILTISGQIAEKNAGNTAVFDLAMLEKLPQQTFTTKTPWDKQPVKFSGPLLRDVLAAAKASGTTLNAMALNDYKTAIPMEDAKRFDVILAHKMNGEAIPVRTKGPLFIIYPFDSKPELQSTRFYERAAWQLKSINVE